MEKPKEKKVSSVNNIDTKLRANPSEERRPPKGHESSGPTIAHVSLNEDGCFKKKPTLKANPRKFPVLPPEEDD